MLRSEIAHHVEVFTRCTQHCHTTLSHRTGSVGVVAQQRILSKILIGSKHQKLQHKHGIRLSRHQVCHYDIQESRLQQPWQCICCRSHNEARHTMAFESFQAGRLLHQVKQYRSGINKTFELVCENSNTAKNAGLLVTL